MSDAPIKSFTGGQRFLGNFYPASIPYEGLVFLTAEHAYQAAKTFDLSLRREIAKLKDPAEAKRFGNSMPIRPDWEGVKIDVMKEIVFIKFSTHPSLKRKLLETGDAYLEEGNSWNDKFWGTVNGQGQNKLGFILMAVREKLRGEIPDPSGFKIKKRK